MLRSASWIINHCSFKIGSWMEIWAESKEESPREWESVTFTQKFIREFRVDLWEEIVLDNSICFSQAPGEPPSMWRCWKAKNYILQTPFKISFCQFDTGLRDLEGRRRQRPSLWGSLGGQVGSAHISIGGSLTPQSIVWSTALWMWVAVKEVSKHFLTSGS